jgi:hypothetical protein
MQCKTLGACLVARMLPNQVRWSRKWAGWMYGLPPCCGPHSYYSTSRLGPLGTTESTASTKPPSPRLVLMQKGTYSRTNGPKPTMEMAGACMHCSGKGERSGRRISSPLTKTPPKFLPPPSPPDSQCPPPLKLHCRVAKQVSG